MKLTVPVSVLMTFIFALLFNTASFSQISIQSTAGYSVNVNIEPVEVVVKGNDNKCTWGYNYDLRLNYTVTITGNNVPKKLNTLQGTISNNSVSHFFSLPLKAGQGTTTSKSNVWRSQADCATATVASIGLNMIDLQIEGEGISYRTVSFPFSTTLPVKMVGFSAEQEQQKVKLSWSTATEIDNDFFTVERSADGNHWTEIKRIKGAGNSTDLRSYSSYDENIAAGTFHYRIKQTDFDGKASYSEVRTIRNINSNKNVSLFPIPNTGNNVNVTGIKDYSKTELTLLNAGGNIIFATTLSTTSVELPQLVTGIYFIRIRDKQSGEVSNFRYVKI
jgi:hypothetical protein